MIKRKILVEIKNHLAEKEMTMVVGPRQAGKTTLLLLLKEDLDKKGEKTLFFNLDIERDKQFFSSQQAFLKKIQLEIGKSKGYIFIDEIQRKENAGIFLKGIYDMNLPHKFIISGSGSLELKEKIHESLSGRKLIFELDTLSFSEFVNFKTNYKYEDKLPDYFQIDTPEIIRLLEEYLDFGGYPRVVLADTLEKKQRILDEIYQSYLEKDITYLLGVKKAEDFTNLVRIIASQIGNLINYSELSSTLGLSAKTVRNYLWYLEKTFILSRMTPFSRNLRKEITHAPIYYFHDLGFRNYALKAFAIHTSDSGFLFQNFIFKLLKEKFRYTAGTLHFWRTQDKSEVDFVMSMGRKVVPLEVKYTELRKVQIPRPLRSFIHRYTPEEAYIVNLGLKEKFDLGTTKLSIIPFYDLIEAPLF